MTRTGILDPGYYENTRRELLPLVDPSWMRILDVGCGAGKLGAALKASSPGRQIHGVEIVEPMAEQARQVLDTVIIGDIQTLSLPFSPSSFDCVIFADVLEHLVDPGGVLRKVREVVRSGGAIVCSIPNIRHYTALQRLILHGWRYDDFGLFDRTHLRFFSLATMKELLAENGWVVESVQPRIVASRKARLVNGLLGGRLREFLALQYLIVARRDD